MQTFTGTLTAADGSGATAQATISIDQTTPPVALSVSAIVAPASGPPGTLYTITGVAAGGAPPYTYSCSPINGIQPQPVAGQPGKFTVTI